MFAQVSALFSTTGVTFGLGARRGHRDCPRQPADQGERARGVGSSTRASNELSNEHARRGRAETALSPWPTPGTSSILGRVDGRGRAHQPAFGDADSALRS